MYVYAGPIRSKNLIFKEDPDTENHEFHYFFLFFTCFVGFLCEFVCFYEISTYFEFFETQS